MEHWAGKRFALVAFGCVFSMASISCPEVSPRRRVPGLNCEPIDCRSGLLIIHRKMVKLLGRRLEYPIPAAIDIYIVPSPCELRAAIPVFHQYAVPKPLSSCDRSDPSPHNSPLPLLMLRILRANYINIPLPTHTLHSLISNIPTPLLNNPPTLQASHSFFTLLRTFMPLDCARVCD